MKFPLDRINNLPQSSNVTTKPTRHTMKYVKIEHYNSNRRRRENPNAFKGTLSIQLIRSDDGEPLERRDSSAVRRSFRSKYRPHVGLKQLAKMS